MKKLIKRFLQILVLLLLIVNLFIILTGRFYLYKGVYYTYLHGRTGPSIYDKDIFYNKTLEKSEKPFVWIENLTKKQLPSSFESKMANLETSSFLVIKNDSIVFEKYWNGHTKSTVSNSFSATKTFVALLVGIALDEGKIKSLDEPVFHYLSSFKEEGKNKITIRHLLMMASGLDWQESGKNPLSENAESYYGNSLWKLVNKQKCIAKPGELFNYQSGNSQLLGFIIEKATGKGLTDYAQEKIWKQIGTESDAYWSLDKKDGDEKAFCCLYGTTRDFARLGRLILNEGTWEGKQIISKKFMRELVSNPIMKTDEGIPNYRYGLHIWTYIGSRNPLSYCRGILGQYIISIPKENMIIIRTGEKRAPTIEMSDNKFKIGHPADLFLYLNTANKLVN